MQPDPLPHSDLCFDSRGRLLATSVVSEPVGLWELGELGWTHRAAQAWLRTPVARGSPRLAVQVSHTRWRILGEDGAECCILDAPKGMAALRVLALSDDGTLAFGVANAVGRGADRLLLWSTDQGAVLESRPTRGTHPMATFSEDGELALRLVDTVLELWRWREDTVQVLPIGAGAAALAVDGEVALVGKGRSLLRIALPSGERLEPWALKVSSITALDAREGLVVVGAGGSVSTLRGGVLQHKRKTPARFVAAGPGGRVAASDGRVATLFDPD